MNAFRVRQSASGQTVSISFLCGVVELVWTLTWWSDTMSYNQILDWEYYNDDAQYLSNWKKKNSSAVIQVLSTKSWVWKPFPRSTITSHECGIKYRNSMVIIVIAGFLLAAVHCVQFKRLFVHCVHCWWRTLAPCCLYNGCITKIAALDISSKQNGFDFWIWLQLFVWITNTTSEILPAHWLLGAN